MIHMVDIGKPVRRINVVPLKHPPVPTRDPQIAPPSREPVKRPEKVSA